MVFGRRPYELAPEVWDRMNQLAEEAADNRKITIELQIAFAQHLAQCQEQNKRMEENQRRIGEQLEEQIALSREQNAITERQHAENQARYKSLIIYILGGGFLLTLLGRLAPEIVTEFVKTLLH